MGLDSVKRQFQSSVLLVGLSPLGIETAKNLVLSGLKKLTIVDNKMASSA
jgi:molybdopterin/thiamine biosynthesis adenylyltransferase